MRKISKLLLFIVLVFVIRALSAQLITLEKKAVSKPDTTPTKIISPYQVPIFSLYYYPLSEFITNKNSPVLRTYGLGFRVSPSSSIELSYGFNLETKKEEYYGSALFAKFETFPFLKNIFYTNQFSIGLKKFHAGTYIYSFLRPYSKFDVFFNYSKANNVHFMGDEGTPRYTNEDVIGRVFGFKYMVGVRSETPKVLKFAAYMDFWFGGSLRFASSTRFIQQETPKGSYSSNYLREVNRREEHFVVFPFVQAGVSMGIGVK